MVSYVYIILCQQDQQFPSSEDLKSYISRSIFPLCLNIYIISTLHFFFMELIRMRVTYIYLVSCKSTMRYRYESATVCQCDGGRICWIFPTKPQNILDTLITVLGLVNLVIDCVAAMQFCAMHVRVFIVGAQIFYE